MSWCHAVYLFAQIALLANDHCNESLVWLKASAFCYTLTETPLRQPAVALTHGNSAALILQDQPLHALQQLTGGTDVRVAQLKSLDLGLSGGT